MTYCTYMYIVHVVAPENYNLINWNYIWNNEQGSRNRPSCVAYHFGLVGQPNKVCHYNNHAARRHVVLSLFFME